MVDENGVAVPSARLTLTRSGTGEILRGESDYAGRHEFVNLAPTAYQLRAEKEGFYVVQQDEVRVGETEIVEVVLNHQQEFVEVTEVVASPPAIDRAETAQTGSLNGRQIIQLPYPTARDIRYALPLIPGVLQDGTGQVHIAGSDSAQTFQQLDGFNISHPPTGLFVARVSVDALRAVEVQKSRYAAEYGKGSGGTLSLATGMGDDRYRFSSTDFVPSFQTTRGLHVSDWMPRATLSGPLRKGRAWFINAFEGDYDLQIIKELPEGADRSRLWQFSNLAKAQVNLKPAHILTMSFLVNRLSADSFALSRFNPIEATIDLDQRVYVWTVKEQSYFSSGAFFEIGLGVNEFREEEIPQGANPYVITPEGTRGNYFSTADLRARRYQGIANLFLPPLRRLGRHQIKLGAGLDRIADEEDVLRRRVQVERTDGTLAREINFEGFAPFRRVNGEASAYAQDRWTYSERGLVEFGLRYDWTGIVRRSVFSPRIAFTHLLTGDGKTKFVAGIGTYYDALNLSLVSRPLAGRRFDLFYSSDGLTLTRPPLESSFQVDERALRLPRFLNWSVGLERELPRAVFVVIEFLQKRGRDGLAYFLLPATSADPSARTFELRNRRRDRYDALEVVLRRTFKGNYPLLVSYTRSAARSNAVLDFNQDSLLFSPQVGGPLPWDVPHRLLTWALVPLVKGFDFAYTLDWRDGFALSLVNANQELVGSPGSRRFPAFFSLSANVERRFRLLGFQWALRAGFANLTNHANPTVVNNNVDSPGFLTFGGGQERTLTARIRFLGRK